MRLCDRTRGRGAGVIGLPDDRRPTGTHRIVHLGLGAFARAHLGAYTQAALTAGGGDWSITGVSLRSGTVRDQLEPQDGLYLVAVRSAEGTRYRMIGALRDVIVLPEQPDASVAALADPATAIVTLTVTEKGYGRASSGGLDRDAPDLAHDLAGHGRPRTIHGLLHAGLRRRRDAGSGGVTVVSCDNLSGNGALLKHLFTEFLAERDPALIGWVERACRFPSTMVDRIVPATTAADRRAAEQATALRDEGLVVTEPFAQWVIEDDFAGPRPAWQAMGAQFVADVAPFEAAKLRMLNAAHSALAYLGLQRGHEFVHQAIADDPLRGLVDRLMRDEAAPAIVPNGDQDLDAYADQLIGRFGNPALDHRLAQIATDGSQKVAQRWLDTLAWHQDAGTGQACPAILTALAAWLRHVRGDGGLVDDPFAEPLAALWRRHGADGIVAAVFGRQGLIESDWRPSADQHAVLVEAL